MMPGTGLTDLVARAFEVACDDESTIGLVQATAEHFGAQQAAFVVWPIRRPSAMLPITFEISAEDIRAHFEFRDKPDTLFGKLATLPAGETFVTDGLSAGPPEQTILAGVICADEKNRCGILLARDKAGGDYSDLEHESLRVLVGYFERAIALNHRFVNLSNKLDMLLAVLDGAPRGIIAFGQNGQVVHANAEARRILAESDGLRLVGKFVHFHDDQVRRDVQQFLEYAREVDSPEPGGKRLATTIRRRSMGRPYQMMTFALPLKKAKATQNEDEALAAMVVYDPATGIEIETNGLKTFYKLSPAEARLAESLVNGDGLPEAAESLGISINTARSQLRGIFKKVGVQSQAALLKEFGRALKLPELQG